MRSVFGDISDWEDTLSELCNISTSSDEVMGDFLKTLPANERAGALAYMKALMREFLDSVTVDSCIDSSNEAAS